jgi:ABC-type dipeptide/oligopeptide/nickel transport system permease component
MRTLKYIGRRLLVLVPQLFLISIITFTLVRMLPGDPTSHCRSNTSPTSSVFFRVTSAGPGSIRARLLKIFSSARQRRLSSSLPEC